MPIGATRGSFANFSGICAKRKSPVTSGAPSCLAPNKSQFNRCSVAPLPGTTPFFPGPAQRGAGRASDWGGCCAAARDADVVPGTALVRLAYQVFGRNHQASTRRNPNVDLVQRERVNGAKADAYFGISAPNRQVTSERRSEVRQANGTLDQTALV